MNTKEKKSEPIFTVTYLMPVGGIGATKRETEMHIQDTPQTREIAHLMPEMFVAQDDPGTPARRRDFAGSLELQTPQGWDTVYTPVFNLIERPIAPMLVIRVETDWYVHDSDLRYVLQPGETISASHSMPVGQVISITVSSGMARAFTITVYQALKPLLFRERGELSYQMKRALVRDGAISLEFSVARCRVEAGDDAEIPTPGPVYNLACPGYQISWLWEAGL